MHQSIDEPPEEGRRIYPKELKFLYDFLRQLGAATEVSNLTLNIFEL